MAEDANRKPMPPSFGRDEERPSAGVDPLLELSRLAGFDDKPEEEAQPEEGGQFDLEDALMAELGDRTASNADVPREPAPQAAGEADLDADPGVADALPDFAPPPADNDGAAWSRPEPAPRPAEPSALEQRVAAALGGDRSAEDVAPTAGIKLQSFDSYLKPGAAQPEPAPEPEPEPPVVPAADIQPEPPFVDDAMRGALDDGAGSEVDGLPPMPDWGDQPEWEPPLPEAAMPGEQPEDAPQPEQSIDGFADPFAQPQSPVSPFASAPDIAPPTHDPLPDEPEAGDPFNTGVDDALFEPQQNAAEFEPFAASQEPSEPEPDDLQSAFEDVFDAALGDAEPAQASVEEQPQPMIDPIAMPGERFAPGPDAMAQLQPEPVEPEQPSQAAPEPDPVDELTAIMGMDSLGGTQPTPPAPQADLGPNGPAPQAPASAAPTEDPMLGLDAMFDAAVEQGFSERLGDFAKQQAGDPAAPPMSVDEPPVLDTIDMDGFNTGETTTPEVSASDAAAAAAASGASQEPPTENADAKIAAAAAALGAVAASKAPAAPANNDSGFDDTDFEAELARDMEFVDHDLRSAQAGQPNEFFDDQAFDEPAVAEAAAANRGGRNWRGIAIGGVLGVAVIGGVGAFLMLNDGGTRSAGPVLVEAGDDPVKIVPDDPGGQTVPNQDRAVFDEGGQTPSQPALVRTAEEPVDIATAPIDGLPAAVGTGEKSEERLTEGGTEAASAANEIETITPRRVRTLIVRPDGTLEERAPAAPEPQGQEVAAATPSPEGPVIDTTPAAPTEPVSEAPAAALDTGNGEATLAERFGGPTPQAQQQPADQGQTAPAPQADSNLPVVQDRPAAQPEQPAAPAPQEVASVPQVTTGGASSGFSVQLAALPSEAEAQSTATTLSQRYGDLIAGRGISIQRAVIDGRGTFYRVRVAANDRGDANQLCDRIRGAGGNCFVAR